ncbi:uncharacterized protein LOC144103402 [Amblyomma americanum]
MTYPSGSQDEELGLGTAFAAEVFDTKNGIFYDRKICPDGPSHLLVIPLQLRSSIIAELHDLPVAGHLDVAITYDRIRRRFLWSGLYRTVQRYVTTYDLCQRKKKPSAPPPGLLHSIDVPVEPTTM